MTETRADCDDDDDILGEMLSECRRQWSDAVNETPYTPQAIRDMVALVLREWLREQ